MAPTMSPRPGTRPIRASRPKRQRVPGSWNAWSNSRVMIRSCSSARRPRSSRPPSGPLPPLRASTARLATWRSEQGADFRLQRRVESPRILHHEEVARARQRDGVELRQHLADARFVDRLAEIRVDGDDGNRDVLQSFGEVVREYGA